MHFLTAAPVPDATQPIDTSPLAAMGDDDTLGLREGQRLGHRYVLQQRLGRGGMGEVYLARDEMLGKDVALKFMRPNLPGGSIGTTQLRKEVLLAQQVTHHHVCRIYDLEEVAGLLLIKMEYIPGRTLDMLIQQQGPLGIAETLAIARQVVTGLQAAHARDVVHCDLKPANILVDETNGRVVLMDFGIARAVMPGSDHGKREAIGTPEYMAPEQVRNQPLDARCDLYALGCVLFHMLTGHVPYPATDAVQAAQQQLHAPIPDLAAERPEIPSWLQQLITQLLAKEPASRPPDATAVLARLDGPRLPVAAPLAHPRSGRRVIGSGPWMAGASSMSTI